MPQTDKYLDELSEALPQQDRTFDMIEHYPGTPNDFNYYGIELRLEDGVEVG
jgi:hypothetical protein